MSGLMMLHASGSELADAIPAREYNRLLQLPRDRELEGDLRERADAARSWYTKYGKPFVAARRVVLFTAEAPGKDEVHVGDAVLHSVVLARRLQAGEAHALMMIAASAGLEVAQETARHWSEGRPDEGYFLDRFAVAVTERLLFWSSATLCRAAEGTQETLLQHLSPGCGNWDIEDQHKVWNLLAGDTAELGPMRILESGALHPQHSVLAVLGVTHRNASTSPEQLCRSCDLKPCAFRRAPFSGDAIPAAWLQFPRTSL